MVSVWQVLAPDINYVRVALKEKHCLNCPFQNNERGGKEKEDFRTFSGISNLADKEVSQPSLSLCY